MDVDARALPTDAPIGIVGAGTMGAGIAQVAAAAGHPVRLHDARAGAAAAAIANVERALQRRVDKGLMPAREATDTLSRLHATDTPADLSDCTLVVEAIAERLDAKRTVLCDLEARLRANAILATNTSSLSITAIGAALRRPARLAGMHFFNPAPAMPLVEIVSGAATSPEVAACLHATAAAWGKHPVHARSTPGFIVNRVARPFYAEALRVLGERAADVATIDALLREAGGFRMGPFELMDLIGHDVNFAVTRAVFDASFGDPRFTPSLLQQELVDAGFLGRKSGRGFYDHGADAVAATPRTLAPQPTPARIRLHPGDELSHALAERLRQARVPFEVASPVGDGRIAACEGCTLHRTDGRTATQRAAQAPHGAGIVLVDACLDAHRATRLAIAVADQAGAPARDAAAGLLQAAGYAVSAIDDVPGMVVLRTVAMLANEAADAVHQGVCDAAGVDLAMRMGVNYPRGPLAWAEALGLGRIVATLDHLAMHYGEDRYRVSPLLRRKQLAGGRFFDAA